MKLLSGTQWCCWKHVQHPDVLPRPSGESVNQKHPEVLFLKMLQPPPHLTRKSPFYRWVHNVLSPFSSSFHFVVSFAALTQELELDFEYTKAPFTVAI